MMGSGGNDDSVVCRDASASKKGSIVILDISGIALERAVDTDVPNISATMHSDQDVFVLGPVLVLAMLYGHQAAIL